VARLSSADQDRLYHIMQLFLKEVPFEGCGGLELRDEIQVTIAAQACLLLLKTPYPRYKRVRRVLVYPFAFVPKIQHLYDPNQPPRPDQPVAGQAWLDGVVVLGWEEVKDGAQARDDGHNVVFHEFAHMLDAEDGKMDASPSSTPTLATTRGLPNGRRNSPSMCGVWKLMSHPCSIPMERRTEQSSLPSPRRPFSRRLINSVGTNPASMPYSPNFSSSIRHCCSARWIPRALPNMRLKLAAPVICGRIAFVNVKAWRRSLGAIR
jgi:hypothetical protein